jgi:hypothetical protein
LVSAAYQRFLPPRRPRHVDLVKLRKPLDGRPRSDVLRGPVLEEQRDELREPVALPAVQSIDVYGARRCDACRSEPVE